jgi:hypothetical protein
MKKLPILRWSALAFLASWLGLTSTGFAQDGNTVHWSITPYLWAPMTKVDLKFRDANVGTGEISFNDLLDTLDMAGMIQIEGGKGNWSAFGDLTYLDTSDTTQRTLLTVDAQNKMTVLDTAVAYWPDGVGSALSLFGGMRYTGFDDTFRISLDGTQLAEVGGNRDYYDALLGARYRFDLSERWQLLTHGDYSFGDSDGTFVLRAILGYTVGKRKQNRIMLGYQYKQGDFKDGDLSTDFTYYGPLAGFNFRF